MAPTSSELKNARTCLNEASKVVCFSGAGLSAESGISTFRDHGTGSLWSRYDPMKLASPEGFAEDPDTVIQWYNWRRQMIANAHPNAAHRALAARPDISQITQNVDNLLERAGCEREQVIHLHGDITRDRCHNQCGFSTEIDLIKGTGESPCPRCGAPLRPAVVWFGESLPQTEWQRAETLCQQADCLMVAGTSAQVYPAAGLIELFRHASAGHIIIVNTQPSVADRLADFILEGPCGDLIPKLLQN